MAESGTLRIIDYVMSAGGGSRFTLQMLLAFREAGVKTFELVSHGEALARYRDLFARHGITVACVDIPPLEGSDFRSVNVPPAALNSAAIWFPWIHRHRLPAGAGRGVTGSFHDALLFSEPVLVNADPVTARAEEETVRRWLQSPATIIASSNNSLTVLQRHFGCAQDRVHLAPLSGEHDNIEPAKLDWPFLSKPFILCPANISPHKNHEVLFRGYAKSRLSWPLVLTGYGTELEVPPPIPRLRTRIKRRVYVALGRWRLPREEMLRNLARRLGLSFDKSLLALGYIDEAQYEAVLRRAAALVMPTLGEGGGSFPVEEALLKGIPVICSDIPVMREHMARLGAEPMWFDPRNARTLKARFKQLAANYPALKAEAMARRSQFALRRWSDVAADYLRIMDRTRVRESAHA